MLDHFKTNVSNAEPTHLVCAWCPQPARGDAWHNDGKLHPSCGQIDHGQGWVPPYTPRAAVPDAATEELAKIKPLFENLSREYPNECNKRVKAEAERDAATAAVERVRAIHRRYTYYELEDSCSDTSDEHREEHHRESDEIGEFYCELMPTGDVVCDLCRDVDGERMEWPCPTVAAIDEAPEPEWEYQCTNNINTTVLLDDPEIHAKQCAGRIERRRKAGPWMPVEGEGNA